MTGESYTNKPVGKIINRGNPSILVEKKLTAAAKPGMLAVIDGNDYQCKPSNGTAKLVGWIGFEHTDYRFRPENYDTAYAVGDTVGIVAGGGFEVYALLTASAETTITDGDLLADNGDGTLKVAGTTDTAVAIALESKTLGQGTVSRIAVKSLI